MCISGFFQHFKVKQGGHGNLNGSVKVKLNTCLLQFIEEVQKVSDFVKFCSISCKCPLWSPQKCLVFGFVSERLSVNSNFKQNNFLKCRKWFYIFILCRFIIYFATKQSPTEHVLNLWEARHQGESSSSSVADLLNSLRVMGRMDAVAVIENGLTSEPWL